MSWYNPFSDDSPDSVGDSLLKAYFEEASAFAEFSFADYEAWLTWLKSRVPDLALLIGELVISNVASTSVDDSRERMISLANQSRGQATIPELVQAAGGRGDSVNWGAGLPEIAINTTTDVAALATEVAQNVGQGVISTMKLAKYLPWILGGSLVLYIVVKGGGLRLLNKSDFQR